MQKSQEGDSMLYSLERGRKPRSVDVGKDDVGREDKECKLGYRWGFVVARLLCGVID
jgi:hypothetical protein